MEFVSDGNGSVSYIGLSLFQTSNGAYTGNILASEEEKENLISLSSACSAAGHIVGAP